jgi:adenosine deaminase
MTTPTIEQIRRAPKVLLHDHLDGGLRPQTLLELADQVGYGGLPTIESGDALQSAIQRQAQGGDLSTYLGAFRHTTAVLQTPEALQRVAEECAADLVADGVIYAEVRFAPESHTRRSMNLDDAIEAVLSGLTTSTDSNLTIGLICTALRHEGRSAAVAEAAVRWQAQGVVGFDLAGPEHGYPIDHHAPAVRHAQQHGLGITLHAGEGAGVESIEAALDLGATRIGHGVRIIEDIATAPNPMGLGDVAARLLGSQVALEICPTSNVHTGVAASIAVHPAKTLLDAGLAVTINTDNRLMSGLSTTSELASLVEHQSWDWHDLESVTDNAIDASYQDESGRASTRSLTRSWYRKFAQPPPGEHGGS